MKKIGLISLLLFALPLFAQTPNLNHAYGGIMMSYANVQTQPSGRGNRTHIFMGMGHMLSKQIFIGSEFYVDLGDINIKSHGTLSGLDYNQNLAYRGDYGIKFRLGFVTPYHYLLYALAGYNRGRFRDDMLITDKEMQRAGIWRNGYLYGAGIEVPLQQHLFLRLEVSQTRYKHFRTHFNNINIIERPKATSASAGLSIAYYL